MKTGAPSHTVFAKIRDVGKFFDPSLKRIVASVSAQHQRPEKEPTIAELKADIQKAMLRDVEEHLEVYFKDVLNKSVSESAIYMLRFESIDSKQMLMLTADMYLKLFPLHLAIMTRNEDISDTLKLLVTSQENILSILTWRDIEGRTPLHIASTHNGTQGLQLLELFGPKNGFAIAKQIITQGQSVLHVAATNLENVSYILSMLNSREQHDLLMLRDC